MASAKPSGGFHIEACYFWSSSHREFWSDHSFNQGVKCEIINFPPNLICYPADPTNTMKTLLQQAIAKRVGSISRLPIESSDVCSCPQAQIGILFSGGLDSTVVAALTDKYFSSIFPHLLEIILRQILTV